MNEDTVVVPNLIRAFPKKYAPAVCVNNKFEQESSDSSDILVNIGQRCDEEVGKTTPSNNEAQMDELKTGPERNKARASNSRGVREMLQFSEYVSVHDHKVSIVPSNFGRKSFFYLHKKRLAERGYRLSKRKLGEGGFGIVYKVYKRPDKTPLACKISIVRESTRHPGKDIKAMLRSTSNEVFVLRKTAHENLISLKYNFVYHRTCHSPLAEQSTMMVHSYIIMEYASQGTLYTRLKKTGPFESGLARYYLRQIASGLLELHRHGIAHRDLKLGNILLHNNAANEDVVKLADFGLSQPLYTQQSGLIRCAKPAGTLSYMSPELIKSYIQYNTHNRIKMRLYDPFKTDIWALGVCLFLLLSKSHPFGNPPSRREDKLEFAQRVHQKQLDHQLDVNAVQRGFEPFTIECLDLFEQVFEPKARKRVNIYRLVEHDWLKLPVIVGLAKSKGKSSHPKLYSAREP